MYDFIFPPGIKTLSSQINNYDYPTQDTFTTYNFPNVPFQIKALDDTELKLVDAPSTYQSKVIKRIKNKRRYTVTDTVAEYGFIQSQNGWVYLPDVHILEKE